MHGKDSASRLAAAARQRFGTWAGAVAGAGIRTRLKSPRPARRWTQAMVLDAIRNHSVQEGGLDQVWKQDTGLYAAAKKLFGTWRKAVSAAGLKSPRRAWTADLVLAEIQRWRRQGVPAGLLGRVDQSLRNAAIKHFGSWQRALELVGVTARRSGKMRKSPTRRG
jgi:hypothetical protein